MPMSTPPPFTEWYTVVSKYYLVVPPLVFLPYFFIDAPFGRFSPSESSRLLVDGIKSWIVMEIISPVCFLSAFLTSPLTRPLASLKRFPISPPPIYSRVSFVGLSVPAPSPPTVLALLFLTHYANRALISPLRTPARSKAHIIVPILAIIFNTVNGTLMGAFLAALATSVAKPGVNLAQIRDGHSVAANWVFWVGIAMWTGGFAGNIWHDEILLNLRRTPKSKAEKPANEQDGSEDIKPHYAIPRGGLYSFISYPNYTSEWIEWLGFAVAASALTDQLPATDVVFPFGISRDALSEMKVMQRLTPPWLFFFSELFLMLPRAWNGHKWYRRTFPEYPKERKAVVPFLL